MSFVRQASVLLAGFEPFDNDPVSPAWEVARALDGWRCEGTTVRALQVPCVFGLSIEHLQEAVERWRPKLVLTLGAAGQAPALSLERVAINLDDARIPDNAGRQVIDSEIVAGGPAAYFSNLPIKAIVRELRDAGIPARESHSAGTFVGNHVFYGLMHCLARQPEQGTRGGLIHVPYLPEQAARSPGKASMALDTQVEALRVIIRTALQVERDLRVRPAVLH